MRKPSISIRCVPGMDDGIAAGKRRERLRPQQAMCIGNRANGSHHARPAYNVRERLAARVAMAKTTTPLTAQERVILFCTATGVSHAAVGITAHAMQSMAIKGFIVHDRESGAYALTDSGRAALLAILGDAGLT